MPLNPLAKSLKCQWLRMESSKLVWNSEKLIILCHFSRFGIKLRNEANGVVNPHYFPIISAA